MAEDLIQDLLDLAGLLQYQGRTLQAATIREAADRLEQLEAENTRLRTRLDAYEGPDPMFKPKGYTLADRHDRYTRRGESEAG